MCVAQGWQPKIFSLSLALSTYLSFMCTVRVMDYFLAELIAKLGDCLLVTQAPCGDQTRAMLCSSDAKRMLCSSAGVAKVAKAHAL